MTHKIHNFNCRPRQQRLYPSRAKPSQDRQRKKAAEIKREREWGRGGATLGIGSAAGIKVNTAKERTINKERCWQRRQAGRQRSRQADRRRRHILPPSLDSTYPSSCSSSHTHINQRRSLCHRCCHIQ